MAISRAETQILWSSASSLSISSGSTGTSDAFAFAATTFDAMLQIDADNGGTPASGDTLDVYLLFTTGDILGDSGNDYDVGNTSLSRWLCQLDTNVVDPARLTVPIPVAATGFKVYAKNNSAGRSITIRARIVELQG